MKTEEIKEIRDYLVEVVKANFKDVQLSNEDKKTITLEDPSQVGEVAYFVELHDDNSEFVAGLFIDTYDNKQVVEAVDVSVDNFEKRALVFEDGGSISYNASVLKRLIEGVPTPGDDEHPDFGPKEAFSIGAIKVHPDSKLESLFGIIRLFSVTD